MRPWCRLVLLGSLTWGIELSPHGLWSAEPIQIEVQETAGIRRFGYPTTASVVLSAGELRDLEQVRLVDSEDTTIPAQFTALSQHSDGSIRELDIDWTTSPAPRQTQRFALRLGESDARARIRQGLAFAETADSFQVSAYTVRRDAQPLISHVNYSREFLGSSGLEPRFWVQNTEYTLREATRHWTVEKRGPVQVRLRCEGEVPTGPGRPALPYQLTLVFASSKSWVGILFSVGGPDSRSDMPPLQLGVVGDFNLQGRLLWDTDVNYWLYGDLEPGHRMQLQQRPQTWECLLGPVTKLQPYADGTATEPQPRGWGHFQEARENGNVVAFGLGGPLGQGEHNLTLDADGKFQWRGTVPHGSPQRLEAFFHFIAVPAQHTARTSPAAMMLPLKVETVAR